jgi:hypothetical protein
VLLKRVAVADVVLLDCVVVASKVLLLNCVAVANISDAVVKLECTVKTLETHSLVFLLSDVNAYFAL